MNWDEAYIPLVIYTIKHWKLFEVDQQVKISLKMINEFSATHIDQDEDDKNGFSEESKPQIDPKLVDIIANHKIMRLKINYILRSLVPLEKMFDENNVVVNPFVCPSEEDIEDCNIGTK